MSTTARCPPAGFLGAVLGEAGQIDEALQHVLDAQEHFPGGAAFAAAWRDIRGEALAVAATLHQVPRFHEIMREQTAISANDGRDWRTFVMKAYGAKVPENIARCPTMAALLDEYPEVLSATFSYLAPGKHIPVHRGPFRGVLRYHIGLSMPRDGKGELGAILWIDGAPYRLDDETMLSPVPARLRMVSVSAAWPLARPSAPTPPSSAATRSSKTPVVGFMIRV